MIDNEKKQERPNDENKAPSRIEVKNMLLEAKLDIARWKITLLLAFLALLGIILPFVLSLKQEYRVNNEIKDMENRFEKLAGTQLRKPKIICRGINNEPLQGSIFEIVGTYSRANINIHNEGDGLAGQIDAYIYFKDEKNILGEGQFGNWEKLDSEDKNYSIKFLIGKRDHISPHDRFTIPTYCNYFNFPSDSNIYETNALLKVYYGEQEPISVPFTFRLKR